MRHLYAQPLPERLPKRARPDAGDVLSFLRRADCPRRRVSWLPRALASIVPRMLPSFSPVNSTTSRLSPTTSSTVQWSHQNDVSILIDGDVLNLTGVVNDTSYEFRSRLTVQFYFTQKAVGASTALLESSLQYPTGEKDPETQEPTYTPTEPPETDSKSGPWGDEEEPIVVPTFEPSASGGGTEELAKEETGYFTEVEIKEETGNE